MGQAAIGDNWNTIDGLHLLLRVWFGTNIEFSPRVIASRNDWRRSVIIRVCVFPCISVKVDLQGGPKKFALSKSGDEGVKVTSELFLFWGQLPNEGSVRHGWHA